MAATLQKPRWETWENACIQTAFTEKIQHKIMAAALGRTVPSVSKKIKALGLRPPSSLRGHVKGQKRGSGRIEKTPRDLERMLEILKTYAPLECYQEGHFVLGRGSWTQAQDPKDNHEFQKECFDPINYYDFPFSFVKPFEFVPSTEPPSNKNGIRKIQGELAYVPLHYVEQWAVTEGFQKTKGELRHRGLSYWKDGTYFSQAQLLMHVNRLRFKHHLQPIALMEREEESLI